VQYNTGNPQALGWIGQAVSLTNFTCAVIPSMDAAGNLISAPFDFELEAPNDAWLNLPCSASASESQQTQNWRNCSKIVYHVYYNEFLASVGVAPRMSNLLAAVYTNEISALYAAAAVVPSGLNNYEEISISVIAEEAHRANYWSVVYELRPQCVPEVAPTCTSVTATLTRDEVTERYLYQIQSWYQLANSGDPNPDAIGDLLISNARGYVTIGINALSTRRPVGNGTARQWGNYGYGQPGYSGLFSNPLVAYCYTVREFSEGNNNPEDAVYISGNPAASDTWNDYRFVIITAVSLGVPTSTYNMERDHEDRRPPWLNLSRQENGRTVYYRNTISGRVYLNCQD
jgi:hypothetical protein